MKTLFNIKINIKTVLLILFSFNLFAISTLNAAVVLLPPIVGSATSINSKGFTANWTPVINATGYTVKIYWGTTCIDSVNVSGQISSSAVCTNLVPNTTFSYKVIARGDVLNYLDSPLSASSNNFTLLTATIPTNKLKIILKLDDFIMSGYALPELDYLKVNSIKFGLGVVTKSMTSSSLTTLSPYIFATNSNGDSLIEVWHHGLDHSYNSTTGIYEFKNSPYADQKLHFDSANAMVKRILGIQMHSFGTPYNNSDANTNTVLLTNPNYKVFMLSQVTSTNNGIFYMNNLVPMEQSAGIPVYKLFVANYLSKKSTYLDYMMLQGHPNSYTPTPAYFDQFKLIVQFLISEGVEFVRPYDYYRFLSLKAPSNLTVITNGMNSNSLSWTDNSTTENSFIIERSTDSINWTKIGTTPANVSTFVDNLPLSVSPCYYRVCANCGIKSDYSNVYKIYNLTALDGEPLNKKDVEIYQISDKIAVNGLLTGGETFHFDLLDLSGKKVIKTYTGYIQNEQFKFEVSVDGLFSGIYICRLQSNKDTVVRKIVIAKG